MGAWLKRAVRKIGMLGVAGLALLAAAAALQTYGVKPLEEKSALLQSRLARQAAQNRVSDARLARDAAPAAKLAAFYRFFRTENKTTDWLARLDAIARASGVELSAADYKMEKTDSHLSRYEIALPLSGSYAHIRIFLEKALEQIPVLSLDQISFRRKNAAESTVQAEARMTLHLVKDEAP
jgi:uncharacterized small protein (DUF1192 family)